MSKYQVKKAHLKLLKDAVKIVNRKPFTEDCPDIEVIHSETEYHAYIGIVKGEMVITAGVWSDEGITAANSSEDLISRVIGNLMFWAVDGRENFEKDWKEASK